MLRWFGNRKPDTDTVTVAIQAALGPDVTARLVEDGAGPVVVVTLPPMAAPDMEAARASVSAVLAPWKSLRKARILLTSPREVAPQKQALPPLTVAPRKPAASRAPIALPARYVVAVASGKGGVGKSTVSVNLAAALAAQGLRVGLLDADIYGPSLPRMVGQSGAKAVPATAGVQNPSAAPPVPVIEAYGISTMSIGYMVAEDTPMIWRGPMVQSALRQMMTDVAWPELDILLLDMPPGTGDAQLTIAQSVKLSGAVIVSTPQDIALLDARKGLAMFEAVSVPILGIIENMSFFCCPACGHRSEIFGHGGAEAEAGRRHVAFLGAIPLDALVRSSGDEGKPLVIGAPQSAPAAVYRELAKMVWERLAQQSATAMPPPRIIIEPEATS